MAKSLWDEFKDLFKTKEQREQERRDSLADAMDREKDVVKQLEELDRQYRESLPVEEEEQPNLEELFPSDSGLREHEYVPETDEQIEERAKAELEDKKAADKKKLENKYAAQADEVELKKGDASKALDKAYDNLDEKYAEQGENAKNAALKQGVARGSILSSVLKELSEGKQAEAQSAEKAYREKIESLDAKLSTLESELNSALEQLDMKYAVELSDNIRELKQERDKETQKWEKYNQEIRKKQAEYEYERQQDINEFLAEREQQKAEEKRREEQNEAIYGYTGEKQKNYAARYDIAYDFYMSLDPAIALEAFEASPNMQYYLGAYYNKLKKELKSYAGSKYYL